MLKTIFTSILPNKLIEMTYGCKALSDKAIQKRYVQAGEIFGDNVSYIALGECYEFEKHLNTWANYEFEYAQRGYRTISIDDFVKAGGYGCSIEHLVGQKRNKEEALILHAELYRKCYLHRIKPAVDLGKLLNGEGMQSRVSTIPSTEKVS